MDNDILKMMDTEEGRREFKKMLDERMPKVEALRKKFGYYILSEYPEALERYEELMKDDIPEPFKTLARNNKVER